MVGGADQDGFGIHLCTGTHLDVSRASHHVGDQGTTAGIQAHSDVEGLGIKVLVAVCDQVQQAHLQLRLAAHARHGSADDFQVR